MVDRAHEHLVETQRVRSVVPVHVIGRDGILEALAHLAVLAGDRGTFVGIAIAGFDDLVCRDVNAAGIFERVRLDVALVDQSLERLDRADDTQVVEHLVPEAGVQQVQHGVLDAADVQVDAAVGRAVASHPVLLRSRVGDDIIAERIDVAQVVPARPGPLRHDVEVTGIGLGAVAKVDIDVAPLLGATQWRFRLGVLVELPWCPIDELGQVDRKVVVGERDGVAVLVEHDRNWFTPVALAGKEPVAKLCGDRALTSLDLFEVSDHRRLRLVDAHTVEEATIDRRAVANVGLARVEIEVRRRLHGADDVEVECLGELPVTLVLAGDGHDRASAVAHEHVVGDEDRDRLVIDRVHGEAAAEHAGLFFVLLAVAIAHLSGAIAVGVYGVGRGGVAAGPGVFRALGPGVCGECVDEWVLGRHDHVGGAEQRVGTSGEHLNVGDLAVGIGCRRDAEVNVSAFGTADPVALHRLDAVGPVEQVEVLEQAVGIGCDSHHPLLHGATEHREITAVRTTVSGDFFVGEHRTETRAPVHGRLGHVDQAILVQHGSLFAEGKLRPRAAVGSGPRTVGELGFEFADRACLLRVGIEPRVEDLVEDPLRPSVVLDVGGGDGTTVVVSKAETSQLAAHVCDVGFGVFAWVDTGLASMLLCRKAERVVPHRVQHVVARHPLEPGVDIGADVAERMTDVKARP